MGKKLVCEECLYEIDTDEENITVCPDCGEDLRPKSIKYSFKKFIFDIDRFVNQSLILIIILVAAVIAYKFIR